MRAALAVRLVATRFEDGYLPIFWYSVVSGFVMLVGAVRLRSVLLIVLGWFTLTVYLYLTVLGMGYAP